MRISTCLGVLGCLLGQSCAAPLRLPNELTIVTWNIHHGRGLDDRVDLDRIADALRATGADLIALQEVDVGVTRSGGLDIPAELAARLGMHAAFGKNIDFQGGDYGNAVLSRHPIAAVENLHYAMLREAEQRGLLMTHIDTPAGAVGFWNTHIDYRPDDSERVQNVIEILAKLATVPDTTELVVLCGDFNDLPGSRVHRALCEHFVDSHTGVVDSSTDPSHGATYPAAAPSKRIDWVLVAKRSGWRVLSSAAFGVDASDHRGVRVVLARD